MQTFRLVINLEASQLRELLSGPIILAPGAYDALSARLVEQAGFPAVYMTSYGISASRLGKPDLGLVTMTEMSDTLANLAAVVEIPVIADADTGYGGTLNIARTMALYEAAGASAIQFEDQQWPKRCGHLAGKRLITTNEMVAKIKAVVAAREKDTLIIARTDAIAVEGFDAAIKRAESYLRAGADILFVEAPETIEQITAIPRMLPAPHLINLAEVGKHTLPTAKELEEMGYSVAIYPITTLMAATRSVMEALSHLWRNHSSMGFADRMLSFEDFNLLIGLHSCLEEERRFNEESQESDNS